MQPSLREDRVWSRFRIPLQAILWRKEAQNNSRSVVSDTYGSVSMEGGRSVVSDTYGSVSMEGGRSVVSDTYGSLSMEGGRSGSVSMEEQNVSKVIVYT